VDFLNSYRFYYMPCATLLSLFAFARSTAQRESFPARWAVHSAEKLSAVRSSDTVLLIKPALYRIVGGMIRL
jgi:hypothetical protein